MLLTAFISGLMVVYPSIVLAIVVDGMLSDFVFPTTTNLMKYLLTTALMPSFRVQQ